MNDKDRELVERIVAAAGEAGSQGWEYLVQWHFINGVLGFIGNAVLLLGLGYLLKRAFTWKPKEDEAHIARAVCILALVIATYCSLIDCVNSVRDAIAPEGAAIHSALS
jgi:hypothetical protein